jgi:NAD(P)H-quinone oxidoreductase subunit N
MALITTGKKFIRELETAGALGLYVPLEGGHEGRYQRRLRAAGYDIMTLSARGLGDVSAYLMDVHGVRPPHLGKKDTGRGAAVGYRYYLPPAAKYRLEQVSPQLKGLAIWLLEGNILARHELEYLSKLPEIEPRIKVAIELGGERSFSWRPLKDVLAAA